MSNVKIVLLFLTVVMIFTLGYAIKDDRRTTLPDPVKTDGDKYKVLLENEKVRVLEYADSPGARTSMHYHPDFVLYALGPFKRRLTLSNGDIITREFKGGDVLWSKAQEHIGENIGTTETRAIIVELKDRDASVR